MRTNNFPDLDKFVREVENEDRSRQGRATDVCYELLRYIVAS